MYREVTTTKQTTNKQVINHVEALTNTKATPHAEELKQIISEESVEAKLGAYNKEKANEDLFK